MEVLWWGSNKVDALWEIGVSFKFLGVYPARKHVSPPPPSPQFDIIG